MVMKQGRADSSRYAGGKVEPVNHGKSPTGAANIGIMVGDHVMDRRHAAGQIERPMDRQGFSQPVGPTPGGPAQGPGSNRTILTRGSQGKV
jgi:hypothetical protein